MSRGSARVLILHNRPDTQGCSFAESEAGVLAEVEAVVRACRKLRRTCRTAGVTSLEEVPEVLAGADETVVFNLVEGFPDRPEQASLIPALCTAFGKACTGNSTEGLTLSLDKWQSKALLQAAGLPCPQALCVQPGERFRRNHLFPGPYMIKPVGTDASEGIDRDSMVAQNGRALQARVQRLQNMFGKPVLIEQYIDGRELNISVMRTQAGADVLPLAEIDFSAFAANRPRIVGYEAKWQEDSFEYHNTPRIIPAPLPPRAAHKIRDIAAAACEALKCRDYCRVDIRLDTALRPYILEVNANPDISPDAGFAAALSAAGIGYHQFIRQVLDTALARYRVDASRRKTNRPARGPTSQKQLIRWCKAGDRDAVMNCLSRTRMFRPGELAIARELLDDGSRAGPEGHYQSFIAEHDNRVVGWVCFGPTPCTHGTWDLYWIAVCPDHQGLGIGRHLMDFAEQQIARRRGLRIIVETSGRSAYQATVQFYRHLNYLETARIPDFYDTGDPKIVLVKKI